MAFFCEKVRIQEVDVDRLDEDKSDISMIFADLFARLMIEKNSG